MSAAATNSVQFYGLESVVDAYKNKQTPAFAICAGKLLQMTYDGNDVDGYRAPTMQEGIQVLLHYLSSMYQGTTAIYTLKTYDNLKNEEKIRPSTEYSTAFNFRLSDPSTFNGTNGQIMPYGRNYGNNLILEEIQKLNGRLDELESGEIINGADDDDDDETIEEALIGILKDPQKLQAHVNTWKSIFNPGAVQGVGNTFPMQYPEQIPYKRISEEQPKPQPQPITQENALTQSEQEKIWQRIADAIDSMAVVDPKLVDHLEMLASIAKKDPAKFQGLIGMIDLYNT